MAAPDPLLPRNVPDLSLPEKTEQAPAAHPGLPEMQKLVQAMPAKVDRPRDFLESLQEGDRVLAPWHPDVLLAGTTLEFDDTTKQVEIRFDIGETGWVFLNQLLPLEVKVGISLVFRRDVRSEYLGGWVVDVDGEDLFLELHDGTREWTTMSMVLIPCKAFGPPARKTRGTTSELLPTWQIVVVLGAIVSVLLLAMIVGTVMKT
jgi:hypothetical protein